MQCRSQDDFAIYMENKAVVWSRGGDGFALFPFLSTELLFLPPLLNSACLVKDTRSAVWEMLPHSSEWHMVIFGYVWCAEKEVGKVPSLSVDQSSALIRLLDNHEVNRDTYFFEVILQGSLKNPKLPRF